MVTGKQFGAAALLIATFAVGAVAGRASYRWTSPDRGPRERAESGRSGGGGRPSRDFVSRMQREVNLTPSQKDSVKAIIRKWDPSMRAVYDGMRPQFDSLRALVHADIMQVLTEDQKATFTRWIARMDSIARKRSKEAERGTR